MKRLWATLVAAGVTLVAVIAATGSQAQPGTATPDEFGRLVPDVVAVLPGTVHYDTRGSGGSARRLLTFSGAVTNNGAGPLIVVNCSGGRTVRSARQIVFTADGRTVDAVGPRCLQLSLRFTRSDGHRHWHLEDFMRYELRTVTGRRVRTARKQGFCLGDRYDGSGPDVRFPAEPASAVFRGSCGRNRPDLIDVSMGVSVGWGDDYDRTLPGQSVDITGLPSGRYVLVFRANPRRLLLDQHRDNDFSSLLLQIDRSRRSQARILSWCTNTVRCTVAGRHKSAVPAGRIRG